MEGELEVKKYAKYFIESLFFADLMGSGAGSCEGKGLFAQTGNLFFDIKREIFFEHDPDAYQKVYGSIGPRITRLEPFIHYVDIDQVGKTITKEEALKIFEQYLKKEE